MAHQTHPGPGRAVSTMAAALAVGSVVMLGACGSAGQPTSHGAVPPGMVGPSTTGVDTSTRGDIPDTQAYVTYRASDYAVAVPEGWARTTAGTAVTFTDRYNSVAIEATPAPTAPTQATFTANELPTIEASSPGFTPGTVTQVQRRAGSVLLATYERLSPVNPVTDKVTRLDVERYDFWHSGQEVAITLSSPAGSDNVDPWRHVTDSLTWTTP